VKSKKSARATVDGVPRWIPALPWIALVAAASLSVAYALRLYAGQSDDLSSWGQFGDYIGGLLNPLVATFALVALVISVRIQKTELTETRTALERQGSVDILFSLLQQHRELVNSVRLRASGSLSSTEIADDVYQGRAAFSAVVRALSWEDNGNYPDSFQSRESEELGFTLASSDSFIPQVWFDYWYRGQPCGVMGAERESPFLGSLESAFGHIFRSVYQTLKFIYHLDDRFFDAREKLDLVNYLRAQMSEDEFILYALSALTHVGTKSRAIAIAFDFFQKRMTYSEDWAESLRTHFEATDRNSLWGMSAGYMRVG
jgi:hypothetical protein